MAELSEASGDVVFSIDDGIQVQAGDQPVYLASGHYRIFKTNASGSMYAAPGFGVIRKTSRGFLGFRGGVWVPRDARASAKVYVLYETSERLYPDLRSALTVPADEERKLLEQERLEANRTPPPGAPPQATPPPFQPGNVAHSPALLLVMGLAETQRGKPDVIAEMPQAELQKHLKSP